jgi:hypothetical protein
VHGLDACPRIIDRALDLPAARRDLHGRLGLVGIDTVEIAKLELGLIAVHSAGALEDHDAKGVDGAKGELIPVLGELDGQAVASDPNAAEGGHPRGRMAGSRTPGGVGSLSSLFGIDVGLDGGLAQFGQEALPAASGAGALLLDRLPPGAAAKRPIPADPLGSRKRGLSMESWGAL